MPPEGGTPTGAVAQVVGAPNPRASSSPDGWVSGRGEIHCRRPAVRCHRIERFPVNLRPQPAKAAYYVSDIPFDNYTGPQFLAVFTFPFPLFRPISVQQVLVTGGAGFIGSYLVEALLARGDRVTVIDDESTGQFENLRSVAGHSALTVVRGSVGDAALLHRMLEGVQVVYHLAAAVGVALIAREPLATIERNIYPTQLLLDEISARHKAGQGIRFFLASTSEVYGKNPKPVWDEEDDLVFGATTRPRWSYGASKAIDEFLTLACARQFGLPVVIARFFNVVGPRQTGAYGMVLPRFVEAALAGQPLVVHDDGRQVRCFAHVADVVGAVIQLMNSNSTLGRIFNIGSDQPISILDLANQVITLAGSPSTVQFQTYTEAYDQDFEDIRLRVPDLTRLRQAIGYVPRYNLGGIIRDCIEAQKKTAPSSVKT